MKVRASHILVKTEDEVNELVNKLNEGADFAQ
jgi:parvulin-like peptidyl-prolyl isomerase